MSEKQMRLNFQVRKTRSSNSSVKKLQSKENENKKISPKRILNFNENFSLSPPKKAKQENRENLNLGKKCNKSPLLKSLAIANESKSGTSANTPTRVQLFKQDVSVYQDIKQCFHTSASSNLPGREKELKLIYDFVFDHLTRDKSASLYISGAPGTGKTACVTTVLQKDDIKKLSHNYVYINCMSVKTSSAIFKKIWEAVSKKSSTKNNREVSKDLEKMIVSTKQKILLVLDEVDQLDGKNRDVLYKLFEWPALPNSKLSLIGIANALDLTDRLLPRLQLSDKFKPTLLHFYPYNSAQIAAIIQDRLASVSDDAKGIIKPPAIQFCARKVAAVAGDVRKALEVCRRAVEMVEVESKKQLILRPTADDGCNPGSPRKSPSKRMQTKSVELTHILAVTNEVYGNVIANKEDSSGSLPLHQKILLCSILLVTKVTKLKEIELGKLFDTYASVCKKRQLNAVDQSEFSNICTLVDSRGLVNLKLNKNIRQSKISLRVAESEVEFVLQEKSLMSSIMEDVECVKK